ncbi:MAG: ABC transporter ATP-binding protein, partial [Bacteroidetes bacterium]|nr:ABC transporter ATP-binding protein [Bacteroidota bacterium]
EIKRKFDAIVDFAGVERYIDTPVKRYSSGMYVRLAFAVAAYLESEILIVDEVLAVGDMEFQKKCIGKMSEVSESEGRTVLFVSHNMGTLISLCKHGIIMQNGGLIYNGTMQEAITKYSAMQAETGEDAPYLDCSKYANAEVQLNYLQVKGEDNKLSNNFLSDSPVLIELNYRLLSTINNLRIIFTLKTIEGFNIFETADVMAAGRGERLGGTFSSILKIPAHFLNAGKYVIEVTVDKPGEKELFGSIHLGFNITELMECQIGITMNRPTGVIHPKLDWQILQNQ